MKTLSRAVLAAFDSPRPAKVERILQFGEGNFLRAFVDLMVDQANRRLGWDSGVVVVQPISQGRVEQLNAQDGLYTVCLRGMGEKGPEEETRIVQSITRGINPYEDFAALMACAHQEDLRFVVSNTTEAGIAYSGRDRLEDTPPESFPGKVTRLLWERYQAFGGQPGSGFIFLPCELIDDNGARLRECVTKTALSWQLGEDFMVWMEDENVFASTLVDRIVTGYPAKEADALQARLGYQDNLLDTAEPFGLWVIEGPAWLEKELPLKEAGCPVIFTQNVRPYKIRKVRMLNGAHTSMVCAGYLSGLDTVGECMMDPLLRHFFTKALFQEILPQVPLPQEELTDFATSIVRRFENPYNRHLLLSIALNSVSKFSARVLPTLEDYLSTKGRLPACLSFSLAALIAFYAAHGRRGEETFTVQEEQKVLAVFAPLSMQSDPKTLANTVLTNRDLWNRDLTEIAGLEAKVAEDLAMIQTLGMRGALEKMLGEM